jgi:hypothetical protein
MNVPDRLLDENEAARDILHVPPTRLQKDRCKGGPQSIPFIKIGRLVRYRLSDLLAHINAQPSYRSTSEYGASPRGIAEEAGAPKPKRGKAAA